MDAQKLSNNIFVIGLAGLGGAVLWWLIFYSTVIQKVGGRNDKLSDFFGCLFADSGPCTVVKAVAKLGGYYPYEPMLLWISAVVAGVGFVMKQSSRTN